VSAPSGPHFSRDELLGADGLAADSPDLAAALAMAAELESVAHEPGGRPTNHFFDRVSSAIAAEPLPVPVLVARESIRRRSPFGFLGALRDAGRVAFGSGRPVAARGQAFALVLAALLVVGSVGGVTAFAAGQLIAPAPVPTQRVATPSPSISPTPSYVPSPDPSTPPTPNPTKVETPDPGRGGGSTNGSSESPRPSASPTDHHGPNDSPHPTMTDGEDSGGPGGTGGPSGTGGPGGQGGHGGQGGTGYPGHS
jgi:hypothetical protein